MSTTNSGSAREIAPGRLSHFEDASDDAPDGMEIPSAISLPPRRPRSKAGPVAPPEETTRRSRTASEVIQSAPASDTSPSSPSVPPDPETSLQTPQKTLKGPEDRVRPSNVHIPVDLLKPIEAKCKEEGLSHGEVIIVAIEAAYPRLQDLIHPAATAGGSLFASRRSRASRSHGPLTPLNYRLREADFATLDQLVDDFGASSRGHLITAALNDYFHDQL